MGLAHAASLREVLGAPSVTRARGVADAAVRGARGSIATSSKEAQAGHRSIPIIPFLRTPARQLDAVMPSLVLGANAPVESPGP